MANMILRNLESNHHCFLSQRYKGKNESEAKEIARKDSWYKKSFDLFFECYL